MKLSPQSGLLHTMHSDSGVYLVWRCRPNLAWPFSGTDVTGRARKGLVQSIARKAAGPQNRGPLVIIDDRIRPEHYYHVMNNQSGGRTLTLTLL